MMRRLTETADDQGRHGWRCSRKVNCGFFLMCKTLGRAQQAHQRLAARWCAEIDFKRMQKRKKRR